MRGGKRRNTGPGDVSSGDGGNGGKRKPTRVRKQRDYKEEYRRRIQRAKDLGLSVSVGRGHPKQGDLGMRQWRSVIEDLNSGPGSRRRAARDEVSKRLGVVIDNVTKDEGFAIVLQAFGFTRREAFAIWFSP